VGPLLKVVLFAAVVRIVGHRPLAEACKRDLGLLFLCNFDPPKKSTIWRFWRDFHPALSRVFSILVLPDATKRANLNSPANPPIGAGRAVRCVYFFLDFDEPSAAAGARWPARSLASRSL
jgi:hypothetical protein